MPVVGPALAVITELLKLYEQGKIDHATLDAAVAAAIAALKPVGDPS